MMVASNLDEELKLIGKRIKKATSTSDAAHILRHLNQFEAKARDLSPFAVANSLYLKGLLSSKAAVENLFVRTSSSSELLQVGLGHFTEADAMAKRLLDDTTDSETRFDLVRLRQQCAFEAAVCYTVLVSWGQRPSILPDTNALSDADKRKVQSALRHGYALRSRAY